MGAGTRWASQERTAGESGPSADLRPAAPIYREEPHRWQGRYVHEGRQRHTGNEKSHECDLEGGHYLLRLRHKGEPRAYAIFPTDLFIK